MAVTHIDTSQNSTYSITGDDDTYILDRPIWIYVNGAPTISVTAAAEGNKLDIRGHLGTPGNAPAIEILGEDTELSIAKSAVIGGQFAVRAGTVSIDIVSRGLVSADESAFLLLGSDGRLVNHGHISTGSLGYAVNQQVATGKFTLENHGTVTAYGAFLLDAPELVVKLGKTSEVHAPIGMLVTSGAGDTAKVTNDGLLSCGASYAYNNTGSGADTILNRGTIYGDIILGAGDDRFIDKGKFVGEITGGTGSDTFILKSAVTIVEGALGGIDTVRIGRSFTLDDQVENLIAMGGSNAKLTGNDSGNTIKGNSGNNIIAGGASADTLTGGGGKDTFVYAKFDGGDTITDFKQGQDRIRIEGFTQFNSFADLDFVKSGKDVRISFADENGADFILVENQKVGDFDKGDFLFG